MIHPLPRLLFHLFALENTGSEREQRLVLLRGQWMTSAKTHTALTFLVLMVYVCFCCQSVWLRLTT